MKERKQIIVKDKDGNDIDVSNPYSVQNLLLDIIEQLEIIAKK